MLNHYLLWKAAMGISGPDIRLRRRRPGRTRRLPASVGILACIGLSGVIALVAGAAFLG